MTEQHDQATTMALMQRDIQELSERLDEVTGAIHSKIDDNFGELNLKLTELSADVAGLVNAWKTATSLVAFVKWAAALGAALAALLAVFKAKLLGDPS